MYFIIGGWGYANRVYAALKFFVFTMAGSAFLFVGLLALVFLESRGGGKITFDLVYLADHQHLAESTARWLFVAFAIAFAVKTPIFPLHTWLRTPTPKHRRPAPSSWPACY